MITRRDFLGTGIAGTLAAGSLLDADADGAGLTVPGTAPPALHTAVVDVRFPQSRRFGLALARRDVNVRSFSADVTELWFKRLDPLWRAERAAVAGLTTYGALFCLERLAWDHGLRVIYRAAHWTGAGGTIEHALPTFAAPLASTLRAGGPDRWPRELAQWLMGAPLSTTTPVRARVAAEFPVHALAGQSAAERSPPLYSWVIAARRLA